MATDKQEMWVNTADGVEKIIEEIDAGEMTASKQGRAFLAGAATAIRALAAESNPEPGPAKVDGM